MYDPLFKRSMMRESDTGSLQPQHRDGAFFSAACSRRRRSRSSRRSVARLGSRGGFGGFARATGASTMSG
jgi:hypothetical protein